MEAANKVGRPRGYTDSQALEVLLRLSQGQKRRQIMREMRLPGHTVDNIRRKQGNKKPGAA